MTPYLPSFFYSNSGMLNVLFFPFREQTPILATILFLSPCKGFGETYSPEQITEWRKGMQTLSSISV